MTVSVDYYAASVRDNPQGPAIGKYRVLRGGGYKNGTSRCRAAVRMHSLSAVKPEYIGFRLVLPFQAADN